MDRALVKMDDTFRLGYVWGIMQAKTGAFYRQRGGIFVQSDIYILDSLLKLIPFQILTLKIISAILYNMQIDYDDTRVTKSQSWFTKLIFSLLLSQRGGKEF
jgi:hypothetical protein